jgi:fructose-1-phosphate kinase PfkB-like protein
MSAAPPILTLTGNLLLEHTLEFPGWKAGQTQRATTESIQVGGKGINVSKMLHRLGAPNTALAFAGGSAGRACEEWLTARNFSFRLFPTTAPTRRGTVVRDASGSQKETTFLGPDVAPEAAAVRACVAFLEAQPTGTVLAIGGSLPGWDSVEFDPLRDLLHRWPERGSLVVDTYGPPLAWFIDRAAALIRINRTELETLCAPGERKLSSGELLLKLRDRGRALRWAVTDGPGPVWFLAEHNDPETLTGPVVREVSATGSGDVMLACTLFGRFHRGLSWRDAVAWSLPYAAANAAHAGVAEFPDPPAP